jgi:hypothetical protein
MLTIKQEALMRKALVPVVATAFLAVAAVPSRADGPAGSCPVPYNLVAISDLPSFVQPAAIALDQKGNGDGYLCVMPFPGNAANAIGEPVNAIDNRVQAH